MNNIDVTPDVIANVNKLLAEGKSLNQLDKTEDLLNLSRKAFRNRALKANYIFNQKSRQFELSQHGDNISAASQNNIEITSHDIVSDEETHNNITMEQLLNRIKKLESIVFNPDNSILNFKIDDRVKDINIVTRSFRVAPQAVEAFNQVCEDKLFRYTKQQLLSQALYEFADRYK